MDYDVIINSLLSLLSSLFRLFSISNASQLFPSYCSTSVMTSLSILIFLLFSTAAKTEESTRRFMLPMCTTEVVRNYKIDIPGRCLSKNNVTHIYNVTVYKPYDVIIEVPAIACTLSTSVLITFSDLKYALKLNAYSPSSMLILANQQ